MFCPQFKFVIVFFEIAIFDIYVDGSAEPLALYFLRMLMIVRTPLVALSILNLIPIAIRGKNDDHQNVYLIPRGPDPAHPAGSRDSVSNPGIRGINPADPARALITPRIPRGH